MRSFHQIPGDSAWRALTLLCAARGQTRTGDHHATARSVQQAGVLWHGGNGVWGALEGGRGHVPLSCTGGVTVELCLQRESKGLCVCII